MPRFGNDRPALTCVPLPQTTRCRISSGWASRPWSCCSQGSCSARLGTTAEEPETWPRAEHGGPTPPGVPEPRTQASGPGASGRASAACAACTVCRDPRGGMRCWAGGGPGVPGGLGLCSRGPTPSWGGRPDSRLLSPPAGGASHMAGAGLHAARLQALSTLMEDVSLIVNARRLWCAQ